jgi:hypothetical protein
MSGNLLVGSYNYFNKNDCDYFQTPQFQKYNANLSKPTNLIIPEKLKEMINNETYFPGKQEKKDDDTPLAARKNLLPTVLEVEEENNCSPTIGKYSRTTSPDDLEKIDVTLLSEEECQKTGLVARGIIYTHYLEPRQVYMVKGENNLHFTLHEIDLSHKDAKDNQQIILKKELLGVIKLAFEKTQMKIEKTKTDSSVNAYSVSQNEKKATIYWDNNRKNTTQEKIENFAFHWDSIFFPGEKNVWTQEVEKVELIQKTTDAFIGVRAFLVSFFNLWINQHHQDFFIVHQDEQSLDDKESLDALAPKDRHVFLMEPNQSSNLFFGFEQDIFVHSKISS